MRPYTGWYRANTASSSGGFRQVWLHEYNRDPRVAPYVEILRHPSDPELFTPAFEARHLAGAYAALSNIANKPMGPDETALFFNETHYLVAAL